MSVVRNSFLHRATALGMDIIRDVQYTTAAAVHAVEQPVANIYTEARTVVAGTWQMSGALIHLAAYWAAGWMVWTVFGEWFPREKRMIERRLDRMLNKRPRLL